MVFASVNSRQRLEYPRLVAASSVIREPSVNVSSPPVTGLTLKPLASRANSRAPHRLVSVKANAGYPYFAARANNSWQWDAPSPNE